MVQLPVKILKILKAAAAEALKTRLEASEK
jgi:hypothetical protein